MGALQVQRLQALLHAKKDHNEALVAIEKFVAKGLLSTPEASAQKAQAEKDLKSARAEAGLVGRDDTEESKGETNEGDEQEGKPKVECGGPRRGRQLGQKIGKYAARTRIDDLGINTLRAMCDDLVLQNRQLGEAEMMASIHKATGATAQVLKTNLDALSVETLKCICADRKLNVENDGHRRALIDWIQNCAMSVEKVARQDENKLHDSSEEIQQTTKAKACPTGTTKVGKESADMALAAENKPKRVRAATSYNLFMKEEIVRLKGADLSFEHKQAFKQATANWAAMREKHLGAGAGDDAPGASQQGETMDKKTPVLQLLEDSEMPGSDDEDESAADAIWSEVGYNKGKNGENLSEYFTFFSEKQGYTEDDAKILVCQRQYANQMAVCNVRHERAHRQLR